ncbi:polycystic kidney disease protein 1-like 3 [Trematomus bernacchii]|uniref:polycystic kidney disease protein 1-like 3 n=1 Tax=Trematomus bernacchii TaxID=40690 RepID=UPI00146B2EB2|nr:polycystic kidney disease protein 1-like 3 [Trematomus bernacchii]
MNARHSLICFFFLTLRDGNSGLTNAQNPLRTETEGGNITVACSFSFSGGRKMFCKGKCEEGNILVETTGDSAQRGRYSIRYVEGSVLSNAILYVSITKLTKSDPGLHQCGLDRSYLLPDSYQDFEIRVTDAPTSSKPEVTPRPFPTSAPSASTLTTTQSLSSVPSSASPESTTQSLSSVPSSASPERTTQPQPGQTAPAGHDVVLYVGLILLAMFIVLSVALLIFCRKRARKEPPVETEYVSDAENNQLYEEIREEDRGSSSPPAETSTIYSYAKPNQPNGVESTDEYSLVTAATSQKETKDDPGNLNSEVDSSNSGAAPLHSAPCGYTDNALYSDPRVAQISDVSHAEDASPALYSTVSLHQM